MNEKEAKSALELTLIALREFVEMARDDTCPECNKKIGKYIGGKLTRITAELQAEQARNN